MRRRSIILYITLATLAALVATRVNRFPPPELKPPHHAAILDEVIPDITVDMRSLSHALSSVAAKTRTPIIVHSGRALPEELSSLSASKTLHVQNVRLGALLARILDSPNSYGVVCRVEESKITFYINTSPAPPPVLTRRLYDLRPFVNDFTSWQAKIEILNPQPLSGTLSTIPNPRSAQIPPSQRCADFILSIIRAEERELTFAQTCAGGMLVQATPEMHRRIECFLALWPNPDSASPQTGEIQTYLFRDLPQLSSQWNSPAQNANTAGRMSKVLTRVKCDELPLEDFISIISQNAGVSPDIHWHDLAGASAVGAKSPVTLDLKNVTAATALQTALDQCHLGGDAAGFVCVDAFLKVAPKAMLNDSSIRIHDVRDLIEYTARHSQHGATPRQIVLSLANDKSINDLYLNGATTAEQSVRNLFIVKFQQFWQDTTGIDLFAGKLVVHATSQNHKIIATMLATMRSNEK